MATPEVVVVEAGEHLEMVAVAGLVDSGRIDHSILVMVDRCGRGSEEVEVRSTAAGEEVRMTFGVGEIRRNGFAEARDEVVDRPLVWKAADTMKVHRENAEGAAVADGGSACIGWALTCLDCPEIAAVHHWQHFCNPLVVTEPSQWWAGCFERTAPVVPRAVLQDGMVRTDPA